MSEEKITELLEAAVADVPDSLPPVTGVLRAVRARRRRQLSWGGGVAAMALLAGGITAAVDTVHTGGSTSSDSSATSAGGGEVPGPQAAVPGAQFAAPPKGKIWFGVGRTVYAVPAWQTWVGLYCPPSEDGHDYLTILQSNVAVSCPAAPSPSGEEISLGQNPDGSAGDLAVDAAGLTRAEVVQTRRTLPAGWLAVPSAIADGTGGEPSVDDEVAALQHAGFRTRVVDDGYPWQGPKVTTMPQIGTPAREGSLVTVHRAVAPPASATIAGHLLQAGGIVSGGPRAAHGSVHIVGGQIDQYVATQRDGSWEASVPAGTYTVTGTVPGLGSKAGVPDLCSAGHRVTALTEQTVTADVTCQVD
jgi:hypothetical protein